MSFPQRKECENLENVTLVNKTHKGNEKFCFFYKKPSHFAKNFLKKKNDEKEKAIKFVKIKNKCLLLL
jgi:hypothetical protein